MVSKFHPLLYISSPASQFNFHYLAPFPSQPCKSPSGVTTHRSIHAISFTRLLHSNSATRSITRRRSNRPYILVKYELHPDYPLFTTPRDKFSPSFPGKSYANFASNSIFPSLRFSITIRYASKKEKRKLDRDATSISIDKAPIDNFLYFFGEIKNS